MPDYSCDCWCCNSDETWTLEDVQRRLDATAPTLVHLQHMLQTLIHHWEAHLIGTARFPHALREKEKHHGSV